MILDGWTSEYFYGDKTGDVSYSDTINPPKMIGWICPVCGRGLSPFTAVCPCKNDGKGWEITCKSE